MIIIKKYFCVDVCLLYCLILGAGKLATSESFVPLTLYSLDNLYMRTGQLFFERKESEFANCFLSMSKEILYSIHTKISPKCSLERKGEFLI